jgi:hypothetical protein
MCRDVKANGNTIQTSPDGRLQNRTNCQRIGNFENSDILMCRFIQQKLERAQAGEKQLVFQESLAAAYQVSSSEQLMGFHRMSWEQLMGFPILPCISCSLWDMFVILWEI